MAYGKTIELFLADGIADGIVAAELSNWNGKAIKIPRIKVKDSERKDITLPGVYFLFCDDGSVYIGESENVKERLVEHIRDYNSGKESYYWATAVCFTSESLNKTLVRYLENQLFNIVKSNGSFKVLTKSTYKDTVVKESQVASMAEFIDNVKVIIKTLGYSILDDNSKKVNNVTLFYCKNSSADAVGYLSDNGFTVMKGSKISDHTVASFKTNVVSWYEARCKIESDGTVVNSELQKDVEFSSPSAAASIVLGRPSSGNELWKTSEGIKLKDINIDQ